jgi:hypothetical protein
LLLRDENGALITPYVQSSPVGSLAKSKEEFGVAVWTNAARWKLQVGIHAEEPDLGWRVRQMQTFWKMMESNGVSPLKASSSALNAFYGADNWFVESDYFTNTAAIP